MENKEFYEKLNGIEHSDKEVEEYISLCKMSDNDIKKISGAIKTQYAIDGIKRGHKLVEDMLEEDEKIEKIIKVRDLYLLTMMTLGSMFGGTIGKSNDYSMFTNLYFSNKRVFFVYNNYANEPITSEWINREDIIGVKFSNKKIKVKKDKQGNVVKLKSRIKISSLIVYFATIVFTYFGAQNFIEYGLKSEKMLIGYTIAVILCAISVFIKDMTLDGTQIILNNGKILYSIIGSDDYKECKKYLVELGKSCKYK